jgi:hypothetical protein
MSAAPLSTAEFVYDAVLTRIDHSAGTLVFTVGDDDFTVIPSTTTSWRVGSVGRMRLNTHPRGFAFHHYADARLRRDPALDDLPNQRWGWRLGERKIQVRAGMLPGCNGDVVRRDTEMLSIELPREFIDFCAIRGLAPLSVLRAYVADLCELFNWVQCPREDDYSTNGSDERMYAQIYFQRAFGWVEEP